MRNLIAYYLLLLLSACCRRLALWACGTCVYLQSVFADVTTSLVSGLQQLNENYTDRKWQDRLWNQA